MKVELVSYQYRKTEAKRLAYTAEIINRSSADIILFAGHTLLYSKSIAELSKLIRNKRSYAFIETRESDEELNHPYLVAKGKIVDRYRFAPRSFHKRAIVVGDLVAGTLFYKASGKLSPNTMTHFELRPDKFNPDT